MKRLFNAASVVIILLAILAGGMGCALLEDIDCEGGNYINVAVSASFHAQVTDIGRIEPWADVLLEIEIDKSGGERSNYTRTTNAYGDTTEQCQRTFKVYRHQLVDIFARPVSGFLPHSMGGGIYDPATRGYQITLGGDYRLNWDELEGVGWGETYYWSPTVIVELHKNW